MHSNYYYFPEVTFFISFYIISGLVMRKYAPSPGKIEKIKPYFYWMYYTNLVSLQHCLLGIIWPALVFIFVGFEMNREALYVHHLIMINSMSYFLYDLVMEQVYGVLDIITAVHHLCVIFLGAYFYWNKYGGDEYLMTLFLGEISNPCLILRTILKSLRMTNSNYYTIIEGSFAVSFLLIRVAIAPIWMEYVFRAENCPFGHKLGLWVVYTISMSWNTKILGIFFKRYKEVFGEPGNFIVQAEKFVAKIDSGGIEYYIFYTIVLLYSAVYPLVYFGWYRNTLFTSF